MFENMEKAIRGALMGVKGKLFFFGLGHLVESPYERSFSIFFLLAFCGYEDSSSVVSYIFI